MRQWVRGAAVLALVMASVTPVAQAAVLAPWDQADDDRDDALREEVESLVNVLAHADPKTGRIMIRDELREELQGVPLGMILSQIARGNEDGTITLRDDIDIDPYLEMVRRFLESGGAERLESARRRLEEKLAEGEGSPDYQVPDQEKFRKTLDRVKKLLAGGELAPDGGEQAPDAPALPEKHARAPKTPELPGLEGVPLEALERFMRLERAARDLEKSARNFRRELSGTMGMLRELRKSRREDRGSRDPRARAKDGADQLRRIIALWRALAPQDGSRERLDQIAGVLDLLERLLDAPREGLDGGKLMERLLKDANPEDIERLLETVFQFTESDLGQRLIALGERVMARLEVFLASPEGQAAQEWVERLLNRDGDEGVESVSPKAPKRTAPTRMAW